MSPVSLNTMKEVLLYFKILTMDHQVAYERSLIVLN
jgi:hypothetical protein